MKFTAKYILVFLMTIGYFSYGQKAKVNSVIDNEYDNMLYLKTTEILNTILEKGYRDKSILTTIANSYYYNNNMEQASRWYKELFVLAEDVDPELYFRYALALKGVGDYKESNKWMDKFALSSPSDKRSQAFISKRDYKSLIDANENKYIEIKNLYFNSELSDFGTAIEDDKLIFSSSRGDGKIYLWNNQPYLDLYMVKESDENSNVLPFNNTINTDYHESSATFNKEETLMFFTRNNYYRRKRGKDKKGTNRLQIFRATKNQEGNWDNIESVHFNSDDYSTSHPSITKDGKRLYFASDMEGSYGQSDIFVVDVGEGGILGTPINLGESINTEGKETFPFVNTNGDLYFSTDGFPGLGGLDIYVSRELDNIIRDSIPKSFTLENIAPPINSNADDFGFYEKTTGKEGFFSSNRAGGKGDDDIYKYTILDCKQVVSGLVENKKTGQLIPNSLVMLYDANGNQIQQVNVGDDAAFLFEINCDEEYLVRASKLDYIANEKRFIGQRNKSNLELNLELEKDEISIKPCDDLAKTLNIPLIYFDLDKHDITSLAETELEKVLVVLKEYPSMNIEIGSHTDCRGSKAYNEILSSKRAKAIQKYLIEKGIESFRILAKGYGESQLLNNCNCQVSRGSDCSEEEHLQNRRSEFTITSYKGKSCDK